ncbi:MAG: hypothetical protein ABL995_12150 [Bryobacteraceae bacterium]
MPETLQKLRPDRDMQCYFFQPSAIAALSGASASGFTLSGSWRQQFDWAVVEWNRDNVYEHPAFRNLPDGDLSGLTLTYDETRENCVPLDSSLYATVDWPSLRIWATPDGGVETVYYVPLRTHAEAIEGDYACAYADFTLSGSAAGGDYIGLAFLGEHHTYQLYGSDSLADAVQAIVNSINAFSTVLKASASGTTVRVYFTRGGSTEASTAGTNGNRFGVYSYSTGSSSWDAAAKTLANGTSPTKWRVTLNFASLQGTITPDLNGTLYTIPTNRIRKMRWTYAAELQLDEFERSEFSVTVSDWTVTGTGREYTVAGPGSRRIEDHDPSVQYTGSWTETRGNYSGGTIHSTTTHGNAATVTYASDVAHKLYVGLRCTGNGATASIGVDGGTPTNVELQIAGEDTLFRWLAGDMAAGSHTVVVTHSGTSETDLYFDFVEIALLETNLPVIEADSQMTLATDWDTLHSISIAPERTAWFLQSLGFTGRANHYVGALWFYELFRQGHSYSSGAVTFGGTPDPNFTVTLTLGRVGQPSSSNTVLEKLIHVGDSAATLATCFAQELNSGYTGLRASASGGVLTICSRSMGADGNEITLSVSTTSTGLTLSTSGSQLSGGVDGEWRTDVSALPRLNRAVRDWTRAYFAALAGYGIDGAAAFSTELQHGDPSDAAGIAQCGPSGDPILLPTPALQTNFSPTSFDFWKQIYKEMAQLQDEAGIVPYLQFGEMQWWYFPHNGYPAGDPRRVEFSGMPFYDAWNRVQFESNYGHPMASIVTNDVAPGDYPDEVAYLPTVIGNFTDSIKSFVQATYPACRFEVLYPTDVNQTALNRAVNYPSTWSPSGLTSLKTEAFGFTLGRNLDKSEECIDFGEALGFPATQRSHLVGINDVATAWQKEAAIGEGKGFESIVLFALDQFCLIGYEVPLPGGLRRSVRQGG